MTHAKSALFLSLAAAGLALAGCSEQTEDNAEAAAAGAIDDAEANAAAVGEKVSEGAAVVAGEVSEGAAELSEGAAELGNEIEAADLPANDGELDGTD